VRDDGAVIADLTAGEVLDVTTEAADASVPLLEDDSLSLDVADELGDNPEEVLQWDRMTVREMLTSWRFPGSQQDVAG
jgi:hypothetical protein